MLDTTIKILLHSVYEDRVQQISLLQQSDVDWVAVRVSRLTDGPPTHRYQLGYPELESNLAVSRGDLVSVSCWHRLRTTHGYARRRSSVTKMNL